MDKPLTCSTCGAETTWTAPAGTAPRGVVVTCGECARRRIPVMGPPTLAEREAALVAERDEAAHERDRYQAYIGEVAAVLGLDGSGSCLDRAARVVAERDTLAAQLAAYATLPPEPDTAMAAFMAVIAVDNDAGQPDCCGRDCEGVIRG